MLLYAKILAADGLQLTFCGILKALDLFKPLAIVYSITYYIIGFSMSYYYGFHLNQGEKGIWTGWLYAAVSSMVIFVIIMIVTEWKKQHI